MTVDKETGIPVVTVCGDLTRSDFRHFLSEMRSVPAFWDSARHLWDLRQVTRYPSTSELHSLAQFVQAHVDPPYTVATVVAQEVHYGLSRMFAILSDKPGVTSRVFRDYDLARAWLLRAELQDV